MLLTVSTSSVHPVLIVPNIIITVYFIVIMSVDIMSMSCHSGCYQVYCASGAMSTIWPPM